MTAAGNGPATPLGRRLHLLLRGIERVSPGPRRAGSALSAEVGRGPLPIGELFHPLALGALAVLLANDWWAKRAYPGWLTGKLSDLAGLVAVPLALSAAIGLVMWLAMALGARLDPSLRRGRLLLAMAAVALPFAAAKLSAPAAAAMAELLAQLGGHPRIVSDPWDLLTLPALLLTWHIGRAELRLVPRGRVHALLRADLAGDRAGDRSMERSLDRVGEALADVRAAGAEPQRVAALEQALVQRDLAAIDDALRRVATG